MPLSFLGVAISGDRLAVRADRVFNIEQLHRYHQLDESGYEGLDPDVPGTRAGVRDHRLDEVHLVLEKFETHSSNNLQGVDG